MAAPLRAGRAPRSEPGEAPRGTGGGRRCPARMAPPRSPPAVPRSGVSRSAGPRLCSEAAPPFSGCVLPGGSSLRKTKRGADPSPHPGAGGALTPDQLLERRGRRAVLPNAPSGCGRPFSAAGAERGGFSPPAADSVIPHGNFSTSSDRTAAIQRGVEKAKVGSQRWDVAGSRVTLPV